MELLCIASVHPFLKLSSLLCIVASLKLLLPCYIMAASLPPPISINHQSLYTHGEGSSSMDAHEKRDLHALLSFRNSITADPSAVLSNWTAHNSQNICNWYGIRCRKNTKRVVHIDLSLYALPTGTHLFKGTLSMSLGNLSLLRTFNVSGQLLNGRIPPEIGHLKSLQVLDLSWNVLNGSIPVELGLLHKLRALNLSENGELKGGIPREIGQLKALQLLDLSYNQIMGRIPVELGQLKVLRVLDLGYNALNGSIPEQLLLGGGNEFSGNIPHQLGNLTKLKQLSISGFNISGSIPHGIFRLPLSSLYLNLNLTPSLVKPIGNMTTLTHLSLYDCGLSHIPVEIFNLNKLTSLSLPANKLTHIPVKIANLTKLTSYLFDNKLDKIPKVILNLTQLESYYGCLSASTNLYQSPISVYSCSAWRGLIINGRPRKKGPQIGQLKALQLLDLSSNALELGQLTALRVLDLSLNALKGSIPVELGRLKALRVLDLGYNALEARLRGSNEFSGNIPHQLGNLTKLKQLSISGFNISGSIPHEIFRLPLSRLYLSLNLTTSL